MNIVIIGGSGGIGQALVRESLNRYPKARIAATYHTGKPTLEHQRLRWFQLDVTADDEVRRLASHFSCVDILIMATGLLHDNNHRPEKTLNQFDPAFFHKNIAVNSCAGVLVAQHFSKALKASSSAYFVVLSAKVGSIDDNRLGGWLSYRSSKAALNMAIKTISLEWKRSLPNTCVLLFHPGTIDTSLSRDYQSRVPPAQLRSPQQAANDLLHCLRQNSAQSSGRFINYQGEDLPW